MQFENVYIPYGGYWTSPFCRWQSSFATQHPIRFAAEVGRRALEERSISPEVFDAMCLGVTIPSQSAFYGGPWIAGLLGMPHITGTILSQACATSVRCLAHAAETLETGGATTFLVVAADRTSNGPHLYYPDPGGMGGTGRSEDWVMDNFGRDPWAKNAMIQTAENVAKEAGIGREAQAEVTLMRFAQYDRALEDDAAFQKRYMVVPVEVKDARGKRVLAEVSQDEGARRPTAESLAGQRPVLEGGTVTSGTQTFPADGNAGMVLCTKEKARELSRDPNVTVRLLSTGQARVEKGFMPKANVPATLQALERAGLEVKDLDAINTHNPFALNDVYYARELGLELENMNRYGCSLVWGHPQAPMGLRSIMELVEELVVRGGGRGLFTGCAAGDSAAALVVEVEVGA